MAADRSFDAHSKQVCLIAEWISLSRGYATFEDREAELKAACQSAILALERDLRAISEIEESFEACAHSSGASLMTSTSAVESLDRPRG